MNQLYRESIKPTCPAVSVVVLQQVRHQWIIAISYKKNIQMRNKKKVDLFVDDNQYNYEV